MVSAGSTAAGVRPPASLPSLAALEHALQALDREDGRADRTWRGEDLDDPAVAVASPAYVAWQTELLSAVLKEGLRRG